MTRNFKRTKYACYFVYLSMASVFSLPPLLFATFKEMYNISYTLLGTLVFVNFCTQLGVDLVFSFFSKYFNIHKTIRIMPLFTSLGLSVFAIVPALFPKYAYVGLVVGTFIFSVASGLGEVLVSPTISALPSDTTDKDLSFLHSLYGYGFVGVALLSTLFLKFVGGKYWTYLTLFWAILPIISSVLLFVSPLPNMNMEQNEIKGEKSKHRTKSIILCIACIFLGACAENTMSSWISTYTENALKMPKLLGDILGMCLFAILLALTRTAYGKFGKNIYKTLLLSMVGALVCYIAVALSPNPIMSLVGCVLVGICTSMLWPGTLILMEERIPAVGVAAYALMASGGDFGASFAPQALGILVDKISVMSFANKLGEKLSLTSEQIGFRAGMLIAAIFPLLGIFLLLYMKKHFKKAEK